MIRFYFKKGRWRVTSDGTAVNAARWWAAINEVKCLNHKLRMSVAANRVIYPASHLPRQP
jgi:hypothetical protein